MSKRKIFKCPFCPEKYIGKTDREKEEAKYELYLHMEEEHEARLGGLSPSQVAFNHRNNKTGGKCVIDRRPTKWNEETERYERFCSDRCKKQYRKEFLRRMNNKYGKDHLLDDPEQQKKMLYNRDISGEYRWNSNPNHKTPYVGSYEKDFLEFLDIFMGFSPTDVMGPAPQIFYYEDNEGNEKFYIPDFYITSLNLIVEIKDGGDNPNTHPGFKIDKELEKIKDMTMYDQEDYNYIKVVNRDYSIFLNYLIKLKNEK